MRKGFTLIELLIVIGIISILATAVVLVLNPAELLKQARDATRISDFGSIKSAVGLYLATATTPAVGAGPFATFSTTCSFGASCTVATSSVNGTGWVDVDLTGTTGGSPLSNLPLDPSNNSATLQYAYKGDATNLTFELNATLESAKYDDLMTTDGGNAASYYEVGTDPGLNL